MAVRITCIKKDGGFHENPYTAITDLGWLNETTSTSGLSTRIQIYDYLKEGGEAYVLDATGNKVKLITVETARGTKYVKTVSDATTNDNLLSLKECK
jgi:hypothetical protein